MVFTYTAGGATDKDDIRASIGDTDSTAPTQERLEDEEINRFLVLNGSKAASTVAAARGLIAKLARRATEKAVGSLRLVYAQRIEALERLIKDLEAGTAFLATPYAGGISVADKAAVESDSNRVAPAFAVGMLDNPRETS